MRLTKQGVAIIHRDTHMGRWVEERGRLDFDQSALNCYLPLFRDGDVLLNVGANIGCYARAFIGKAGHVFCIEPNYKALECLRYNLGRFQEVTIYPFAASDSDSRCTLHCPGDNVGMAYVVENDEGNLEARAIDGLGLQRVDFILMDCEGYELRALSGAIKTIRKCQPLLVVEINDSTLQRLGIGRGDIFAWLDSEGYAYRNIYKSCGLDDGQLDIICFPRRLSLLAETWGRQTVWERLRAIWKRTRRRVKNYLLLRRH